MQHETHAVLSEMKIHRQKAYGIRPGGPAARGADPCVGVAAYKK